jgi:hypothetical protein
MPVQTIAVPAEAEPPKQIEPVDLTPAAPVEKADDPATPTSGPTTPIEAPNPGK